MVGVEVAAGGFYRGVSEEVLERVQRDACVGCPNRSGVAQAVAGEVRQSELGDDAVTVDGVADGHGAEVAAPSGDEEMVFGLLAFGESCQRGPERFEDRHACPRGRWPSSFTRSRRIEAEKNHLIMKP